MTRISTSLRTGLAIAAGGALLVGLSAPSYAADSPEPAKSGATSEGKAGSGSGEKKICLANTVSGASTVTGSLLSKKQCKTKAQWEAQGVEFGRK